MGAQGWLGVVPRHAHRLFLPSPPCQQVVSERISYQPHYRTLTDGGKTHFSEIAYAVADLVDNSIQV